MEHAALFGRLFLLSALLCLGPAPAAADDPAIGMIEIAHPHLRTTLPGAPVSGGYVRIRNRSDEDDRLLGASSQIAGRVALHEMKIDGDVMTMREVKGGVAVPAGGELVLEAGGLHLMFMQLKVRIADGQDYPVVLHFEKAGQLRIDFIGRQPTRNGS